MYLVPGFLRVYTVFTNQSLNWLTNRSNMTESEWNGVIWYHFTFWKPGAQSGAGRWKVVSDTLLAASSGSVAAPALEHYIHTVLRCLFPGEYSDFASLCQPLDDLGFIVGIVDAGLPELSGVAVLLPVVVPVSSTVCPESKHIHLEESRRVVQHDPRIYRMHLW